MLFFFFKQKTAYEMRISDWSSDVCSSDLRIERARTDVGDEPGQKPRDLRIGRPIVLGGRRDRLRGPKLIDLDHVGHDPALHRQIGRASCRERVCQYV